MHKFEIVPLKQSKRLQTRNILAQSWINFNQWFLRYHNFRVYAFFEVTALAAILTGIFLFNFETTQCKNYFDTNLVKIHQAVIEIFSFSYSVLFFVMANGGHLGMPNCKKSKQLHTRNILALNWINFNQWFLKYRHFRVYAVFSNGHIG